MSRCLPALLLLLSSNVALANQGDPASKAPIAGGSVLADVVTETVVGQIAYGVSVKKMLLGKLVLNEKGEHVGKIDDLIVDPEKSVSYAIVSAGGFLGVGKHDVAIPAGSFKYDGGKIVLPGATKDAVGKLPQFVYKR
jgi:sporulation protein YlmC with PRC-barrel domain